MDLVAKYVLSHREKTEVSCENKTCSQGSFQCAKQETSYSTAGQNQLVHQLVVPGPITSCDWTHQSQLLLVMSSGAPQEVGRMGTSGWNTTCSEKVTLTDDISQWRLYNSSVSKHSFQLPPFWRVINIRILAWLRGQLAQKYSAIWRPHDRHWQTSPPPHQETLTTEGMNIFTFLLYLYPSLSQLSSLDWPAHQQKHKCWW